LTAEFRVTLPSPLDVAGSLELFRRSGDDLIDRWNGIHLVRAVPRSRGWVPIVATVSGDVRAPAFEVAIDDASAADGLKREVAATFVPAPSSYSDLLAQDPVLGALDREFPGIRQIRQLDLFTALIRCISAQQVNLRWAVTTRRRLAEAFGRRFEVRGHIVYALDPERIANADPAHIRALQFTMSKSLSIVATARALVDDARLTAHHLARCEDDEVIARLIAIKGIGRWSAEWILARTLGRPRVVAGDLGVRKAIGLAYLGTPAPTELEVRRATERWGESAGVAQALLLHALGEGVLTGMRERRVSRAAFPP
jgi:DNA-3-methyladenine glycosylase II